MAWAFVAGTVEGGTVLNLKGMLVLELPGPRVLIFVKAKLLSERPKTKGNDSGNLLAVVDISPQRVLIGIQIKYEIKAVLNIEVPVEAGFFVDPPDRFYVDIGTIRKPVKATVLELFDATAYLMVHGDGIPDFPLVENGLQGFSLATGFHVSLVWGNTDIGLYVKVAGGFDAGVGFAPFFLAGRVYFEGALHLFIISLEANAELTLLSDGNDASLDGQVCGRVSFFFFSVSGCVNFRIGTTPGVPAAPALVRDLVLQSRSPALVEGTAVDRGIDTILCRATDDGSVPTVEDDGELPREVFVPIDAIPLLQFEVAPQMEATAVDGELSGFVPTGDAGWHKRGPNYLRYRVTRIELRLVSQGGGPPMPGTTPTTDGKRPYTWRHQAESSASDALPVDLAMLDWKPINVDKAMLEGPALDAAVGLRWDRLCQPAAEPAAVLWSFRHIALGADEEGWHLNGVAWPDAGNTWRSRPVNTQLSVRETWRTGTILDGMLPHKPAEVVGIPVDCPPGVDTSDDPIVDPANSLRPLAALATGNRSCLSRILEAPFEVLHTALTPQMLDSPLGAQLREYDVQREDSLRDVVQLHGGPFRTLTLLIVAPDNLVERKAITAEAFAPGNGPIRDLQISLTQVSNTADLPERWRNSDGPWSADVALAYESVNSLRALNDRHAYLMKIDVAQAALQVDVGIRGLGEAQQELRLTTPSWYLLIVDGVSDGELVRAHDDIEFGDADDDGAHDGLTREPHALLRPDAEYRVVVHYSAQLGRKPDHPEPDQDPNAIVSERESGPLTDERTFFTDAHAPRNLQPWSLVQFPVPAEPHHFYADPVVFVFSTDDVLELYAAYDRSLRAVARAASFRGSAGTPEAAGTHVLLSEVFAAIGTLVVSPHEATMRRRYSERTCRNFNVDTRHHARAVVPFTLDPLTDYVVDIEALNAAGQVSPPPPLPNQIGERPLHRQSLTTSRYANRDAFAAAVRATRVIAKRLSDPAPLEALSGTVSDDVFDRALQRAGLEARPRPARPEVFDLWSPDTIAQPVAVLLETPEPLWRRRQVPGPVYHDDGTHIVQWRLLDEHWLMMDELVIQPGTGGIDEQLVRVSSGTLNVPAKSIATLRNEALQLSEPAASPPPIEGGLIDRYVRDASGSRTLAMLTPGARGATVRLALVRQLHELIDLDEQDTAAELLSTTLTPPPWELP